ncbi:hypothetical protein BOO25_16640 [Vibrio navarrensis]|nr:hypothetical protein [Vibrio navarrensis]
MKLKLPNREQNVMWKGESRGGRAEEKVLGPGPLVLGKDKGGREGPRFWVLGPGKDKSGREGPLFPAFLVLPALP